MMSGVRFWKRNAIPRGYNIVIDVSGSPAWLRAWLRAPVIDLAAYPVLLRRGHAWLVPLPDLNEERGAVPEDWEIREDSSVPHRPRRSREDTPN